MASQKKTGTTASKTAARQSGRGRRAGTGRKTPPKPARDPLGREIAGFGCLFFAILTLCGCLGAKAPVFSLLMNLWRGLVGAGCYLLPVSLAAAFVLLLFSGRRPVGLRIASGFLAVWFLGAFVQLLSKTAEFAWGWALIPELYRTGAAGTSGGVAAGFLAMVLQACFGKGLGAMFAALGLILSLLAFGNLSVFSLVRAIKNRPRPEPEEEPEEPAVRLVNHVAERHIQKAEQRRRNTAEFDLPVDEPPLPIREPSKKTVRGKVQSPDEFLLRQAEGRPAEADIPAEQERLPELESRPVRETPETEEPEPVFAPPAEKSLTERMPPMPKAEPEPVEMEPFVLPEPAPQEETVNREQTLAEAQAIAQQIALAADATPEYRYPPLSLLQSGAASAVDATEEMRENTERLNGTLDSFGIEAHIVNVTRGPSVTRYELELERGVKLSKITNLADDIALSLGASGVRISAIPDKISVVGIEVPNRAVSTVYASDVIGSETFQKSRSKISFAVGKDIGGNCIVGDIARLPHMLIAGTTGSGKSVCMNTLIISLLYKSRPEDVRLIMVDPKMVELGVYNGIPHLLIPVVTDPKKAAGALQWAVTEMMRRYRMMADAGVRDLESYNKLTAGDEEREAMAQIVVVIDELADLMLVAAKEVEESICRIAQMGRASGIHLVIATQRPSADVITGLMKANIPSRIAFAVASAMESRIILDTPGAEKLVGKGDMLYAPLGQGKPRRVQGCFITDDEVQKVVNFIKESQSADYSQDIMEQIEKKAEQSGKQAASSAAAAEAEDQGDELLPQAVDIILETNQASVSMLQRRLKLGYARAARIVDEMEEKGIVGPFEGSKPRQVLITKEEWAQRQSPAGEDAEQPEPAE